MTEQILEKSDAPSKNRTHDSQILLIFPVFVLLFFRLRHIRVSLSYDEPKIHYSKINVQPAL